MRRRALSAAAAAGLIILSSSACATVVCPAIGWSNVIEVTASNMPVHAEVFDLCVDGECMADVAPPEDGDLVIATELPDLTEPSSEQPEYSSVTAERIDAHRWRFMIDMSTPETVTVRALDAAGEPLAEAAVDLDWQHEYPYGERCGGPGTAHVTVGL